MDYQQSNPTENGFPAEELDSIPPRPPSRLSFSRSIQTQTEEPEDSPRPLRRAVSDWGVADWGPRAGRIRSEWIRRVAGIFEDLTQEARRAGQGRGAPRAADVKPSPPPPPREEREVRLVPLQTLPSLPSLPPSKAAQSRDVNAIVAPSAAPAANAVPPAADSDDDGDVAEDQLWTKVREKIAARRSLFQRLESRQDGPEPASAPHKAASARQHSQEHAAGEEVKVRVKRTASAPLRDKSAAQEGKLKTSKRTSAPVQLHTTRDEKENVSKKPSAAAEEPTRTKNMVNGGGPEAEKSSAEKYIERSEEQTVLRGMTSAVLTRRRLGTRQRTRERLLEEKVEAERRQNMAQNQRRDVKNKLEKVNSRLTRDSTFEKQGLKTQLARLEGAIKEEQRTISRLVRQIMEADADIEALSHRVGDT